MQNIVLIGYGNVGKEMEAVLRENGLSPNYIVRGTGIYSGDSRVDESENYAKYINDQSAVFISLPSRGDGSGMLHYYTTLRLLRAERSLSPARRRYSRIIGSW